MIDPSSYLYGVLTVMLPLTVAVTINFFRTKRRWNALQDEERRRGERRKP